MMGWASMAIEKLQGGESVVITPRGRSMAGRVEDGQTVVVHPVNITELAVGDVVLCKVAGRQYLHLVKAIDGTRFQIANNKGRINGWIGPASIYGKAVN